MLSAEEVSNWLEKQDEGSLDGGLFRAHFQNLPGPAYIWRRCGDDFELIAHNRAALGLANGDVRDLLGCRMRELFKDRPDIIASINRCADEQTVVVQETELTFVSGVTRRMLMTRIPLSRDIVVGHMEDVTDRHVSDEELKASERRFRALFESHPDLVFRMDVRGKYLDLHVPEGAMLPWRPEEIVGRNIADLFGVEAAARHRHYAREAVRTGEVQIVEYDVAVHGRQFHVESRFVKSGDAEVVVNVRDITKRVELEEAIVEGEERERARLGDALQRHLRRLRACAAQVSAGGGENGHASSDALAALDETLLEAERLAQDFAPIPAGTSIVTALKSLAVQTEHSFGVRCRVTHGASMRGMTEQTPDLYRVAQEAIANAVRHGRAQQIEMICSTINGQFVLSIVDNGSEFVAVADDDAGFGMRVMRHRAKRLGGKLTRSRRSGGGTMVTCSCPIDDTSSTATLRLRVPD